MATATEPAVDPVCGMTVDPATAAGSTDFEGKTYFFCNPRCLERFRQDPRSYLDGTRPKGMSELTVAPPSGGARVEYICPMDPEVVSDRPGPCPKCGMALEPRTALLDEGPNPELADMTRRFWVS